MTALGIIAIGAGGLLIYAGVTGQSALQIVAGTLSGTPGGRAGSDTPDDDGGKPSSKGQHDWRDAQ